MEFGKTMENLDPTILALAKAIKYTETGTGDTYMQKGGSGEIGAYQFTKGFWNNNAKKYLGNANAPLTRDNQNKVAYAYIKSKKEQGYSPTQIASMWNAGDGKPDAYKQNWRGVNEYGVKYDTPAYVAKVYGTYQQIKPQLASASTYVPPKSDSPFTFDQPVVENKSFLKKVGDFFTGSTQKFGKTIGQALASGKNVEMYAQALENYTNIVNNLQIEINNRQKQGMDVSRLVGALSNLKNDPPKLEAFTGDVINKTTKQILGEAGGTILEATSGGLLSGGKGLIKGSFKYATEQAPKIVTKQTFKEIVKEGAKIGSIYGSVGGATSAMQGNKSTGNIVLDSFVGGLFGAGLGAGLATVGYGLTKAIKTTKNVLSPTEKAYTNAQTNVARAYEKTLNLTPSQRAKEQALLERTGDNVYTTLVKNQINLGSKDAPAQLQTMLNIYEKGIEQAQKNEHALFNLKDVVTGAFDEINTKIPSATARQTAKQKIAKEIQAMLKERSGTIIKNQQAETLVDAKFMERLRKIGNSWTPFNASDPEKIGKSAGYALANAVRDNVEKFGTYPAYREAMREWGKLIHVEQVLGKLEKSGKAQFRVLGGLSGAISRRILSGTLGYHTGGLGGLILGELGGEYGAMVMSNPATRTYFNRLIIANYDKKVTPAVIKELARQVQKEAGRIDKTLRLKAPDYIPMGPKTYKQGGAKVVSAIKNPVSMNPKTGRFQTSYSSSVDKAPITKQTATIAKSSIIKDIIPQSTKLATEIKATGEQKPTLKLKRNVAVTTLAGEKITIPEDEVLKAYEKGGKALLKDGREYVVSKSQYENIKNNSLKSEAKEFAPELKTTEETVRGDSKINTAYKGWTDFTNKMQNKYGTDSPASTLSKLTNEERINWDKLKSESVKFETKIGKDAFPTKYSNYQLPGGENYKEILIKAPKVKATRTDSFEEFVKAWENRYGEAKTISKEENLKILREEYKKGTTVREGKFPGNISDTQMFKGSHWEEPNVLAHLRLNERTYKGKKVTFMEELQSDWAREGRSRGFETNKKLPVNREDLLPNGWKVKSTNGDTWYVYDETGKKVPNKLGNGEAYGGTKDVAIGKAVGEQMLMGDYKGGVPNNPLLKNWQELSVKRALKEAVDNKSEYLAWTNGEQQASRYNLSTQIKKIEWEKDTSSRTRELEGVKNVVIKPIDKSEFNILVNKDGVIQSSIKSDWKGKKLDEVIGKGISEKILAEEKGNLSGEGLNIGGEWAKNLYDKQVKNIVEDLTGHKVEMIDLGIKNSTGQQAIKITPEIRALVNGKALEMKK